MLSPARNPLAAPSPALAAAIVKEWEALGEAKPAPEKLPLTGFAALVADILHLQRQEVVTELLAYGETDLLCYREAEDAALEAQQAALWQPWIRWAEQKLGTKYHLAGGIMPVTQPAENYLKHQQAIAALSDWQLAALAVVVKSTTSLILGLAFIAGELDAPTLFTLARLEEAHNTRKWGEDAEAAAKAARLSEELQNAAYWRDLLGGSTA